MGALVLILVIIGIVIFVKKKDNEVSQTYDAMENSTSHWTPPTTFDENIEFFAQITECLAKFVQKPVDFMVGVDEVNGRYNCFISLINSDCDEYAIALKYGKYPQSAIDYVGKYFDDKYIKYKTTLSAKPNTVPYHYSSLIEDVCSDCVSQDHRLNDPINGSFYIIGASYRR